MLKHMEQKKKLIEDLLCEIQSKKQVYYKKMLRYKKIDDCTEAALIGCNAVAVSSLMVTLTAINPITLIIGAVFTSASSVGSAIKRVVNIVAKYENHKTSFTQLADLERETRITLARNHLTSEDLQVLLNSIAVRLSLIEDRALPI